MSGEAPPVCSPERRTPRQRWVWGAHVGSSFAEDDPEVLLDTMDAPKEQQLGCLGKVPAAQPLRCLSSSLLGSSEQETQMNWSKSSQGPKDDKGTGGSDS